MLAEDLALDLAAPGVLANDNDPDGDGLRALLVSPPSHGSLTLHTNGSLWYLPFTNYHGPDSFSYQAADANSTSGVATVTLTIMPVNDPPVAANDTFATEEDVPLVIPPAGVVTNDVDLEGDSLTALLVAGPLQGTLELNPNGGFIYTPATNFHGADSFTYRAADGATNSEIATVALTVQPVNDPPTITAIASQTTPAGVALGGVVFAVDDLETPAAQLTVAARSSNESLLPGTNILISGTETLRTLTLTPAGTETGTAIVQIVVTDANAASATNEFTLAVLPAANLSVMAQAALPNPAIAGYALHLAVTITNAGPHAATNVVLTDLLPPGFEYLSAEPGEAGCTNDGGVVTAHYAELPPGESRSLWLHVKPASGGDFTNVVSVTATEADPGPADNSAWLWIQVRADGDGDGMPDDWELAHNLLPNDAADGLEDRDGDGLSNRDEFIAGTDPELAASVFRIESFTLGGGREVYFLSATGRVYTLYFNDSPTSNSWLTVPWQARVPGLGAPQLLRDTNPSPPVRAYRLGVELP